MRAARVTTAVVAILAGYWAAATFPITAQVKGNDNRISVMDDCLPGDPGWNPIGGCALSPQQGDVPTAEFDELLVSPLTVPPNGALVGHPSWRNEPSHLTVAEGKTVRVTNDGGRGHTFTEVAQFGGGFVPPLSIGMMRAPECTPNTTTPLSSGATQELDGLAPGLHKFQCCIHPWMRATIRVE
jgi:plastocyanin